jgi:nucleoside-diphosphate-sugar epimerase
MPSRILVVGATGGTGREVVLQALAAGHDVTALARTATRLPIEHPKLRTIDGALPQDAALLSNAMAGQDVVISALGRGRSLASQRLIEQSVPAVLRAMRAHGVRRLIFTSAIGSGTPCVTSPFFRRSSPGRCCVGSTPTRSSVRGWSAKADSTGRSRNLPG